MENVCSLVVCGKPFGQPLQCAPCKSAKYWGKDCQTKTWKAGHFFHDTQM
jgi:hypothetical protein